VPTSPSTTTCSTASTVSLPAPTSTPARISPGPAILHPGSGGGVTARRHRHHRLALGEGPAGTTVRLVQRHARPRGDPARSPGTRHRRRGQHDEPSGLGWLPDGRLLVVAMETASSCAGSPTARSSSTPTSRARAVDQRHDRRGRRHRLRR
jgi:hypothetical protein